MLYFRHMRGGPFSSGRSVSLWLRARRSLGVDRRGGFTLLEVLIVLAVTGVLFVSAAILIVGRQNRTAFEQAARNIQSQIQSAIDQVVVGHYPNNGTIDCQATSSGPDIDAGFNDQGTNGDCIFMGKVMQFGVADTDPQQFKSYTIAGLRLGSGGNEASSRAEAMPTLIAPRTADPTVPDQSEEIILDAGMIVSFVQHGSVVSPTQTGAVAIWQSLASTSGGSISSGAQNAQVGIIPNTTLGMTQQQFVDAASSNLTTGTLDDADGVRLCFVSGSTEQSGLITLGSNGRTLAVNLDIKSNRTCS